jgi:hypothetical protein
MFGSNSMKCLLSSVHEVLMIRAWMLGTEKYNVRRSTIVSKSTLPGSSAPERAIPTRLTLTWRLSTALLSYKDIVHVVTTKTARNKRIDQCKLPVEFATTRQTQNVSLIQHTQAYARTVPHNGTLYIRTSQIHNRAIFRTTFRRCKYSCPQYI